MKLVLVEIHILHSLVQHLALATNNESALCRLLGVVNSLAENSLQAFDLLAYTVFTQPLVVQEFHKRCIPTLIEFISFLIGHGTMFAKLLEPALNLGIDTDGTRLEAFSVIIQQSSFLAIQAEFMHNLHECLVFLLFQF